MRAVRSLIIRELEKIGGKSEMVERTARFRRGGELSALPSAFQTKYVLQEWDGKIFSKAALNTGQNSDSEKNSQEARQGSFFLGTDLQKRKRANCHRRSK